MDLADFFSWIWELGESMGDYFKFAVSNIGNLVDGFSEFFVNGGYFLSIPVQFISSMTGFIPSWLIGFFMQIFFFVVIIIVYHFLMKVIQIVTAGVGGD